MGAHWLDSVFEIFASHQSNMEREKTSKGKENSKEVRSKNFKKMSSTGAGECRKFVEMMMRRDFPSWLFFIEEKKREVCMYQYQIKKSSFLQETDDGDLLKRH